ncbi:MAG: hypothetical protein EA383_15435 [Spirochaetaceae bacterium]|nr:MAG: hypothetical protein EA383_15435 [Spirochaetaceae bacterium]
MRCLTGCLLFLFILFPTPGYASCDSIADSRDYGLRVGLCRLEARPGLPTETEDAVVVIWTAGGPDEPQNAATLRLSRVFAAGSRAILVTVTDVEIKSPLGDGRPVVSVRTVADSYLGAVWSGARTVETYWLTVDDQRLRPFTWFVESTELGRVTIAYTHLFERNDEGRLYASQQYAVQYVDGVPTGVDRTTRRFDGRTVSWNTAETRLTDVEPVLSSVLVRSAPGHSARILDALPNTPDPLDGGTPRSRVRSIAWHESELFYEVYLGRGESGWIPATAVRWVP